jgi:hypothetical protein
VVNVLACLQAARKRISVHDSCDRQPTHPGTNLLARHVIPPWGFLKHPGRKASAAQLERLGIPSTGSRPLPSQNPESLIINTLCLSYFFSSTSIIQTIQSTTLFALKFQSSTTKPINLSTSQLQNFKTSKQQPQTCRSPTTPVPAYLAAAQDLGAAITSGLGDAGGAVRFFTSPSTSINPF